MREASKVWFVCVCVRVSAQTHTNMHVACTLYHGTRNSWIQMKWFKETFRQISLLPFVQVNMFFNIKMYPENIGKSQRCQKHI